MNNCKVKVFVGLLVNQSFLFSSKHRYIHLFDINICKVKRKVFMGLLFNQSFVFLFLFRFLQHHQLQRESGQVPAVQASIQVGGRHCGHV